WSAPLMSVQAWSFMEAFVSGRAVRILDHTDRHFLLLGELLTARPSVGANLIHDAHTAVLLQEHGVRTIYTRDSDFRKFPFLEVVDPLDER
ncbi:MAG: VapC toxin family PIN domain ribonuclease, partial [Acidimicrobiia bacterium]